MQVAEMFDSIQGEGMYMGVPVTFIRFMGCNLSCSFCDTKGSWTADGTFAITEMTSMDIITALSGKTDVIVLTGGEPCLQDDLEELVPLLQQVGYVVCVETNGTKATPIGIDWVTCSPKADAGYNINPACRPNELKYVVTPEFNADEIITEEIRSIFNRRIWLQPEGGDMQAMWQKCFDIAMADPRLRVGIQLHKLMEVR